MSLKTKIVCVLILFLGIFSLTKIAISASNVICSALASFNNITNDASGVIQGCINQVDTGGTVELPAGKYYVRNQIAIDKAITLKTQGKIESMTKCNYQDDITCAELIADPHFLDMFGVIRISASNVTVDHLIINGNKANRQSAKDKCLNVNVAYGRNVVFGFNAQGTQVNNNKNNFLNSVSKNGVCSTALHLGGWGNGGRIYNNTIAFNGWHEGPWSDGLTGGVSGVEILNNEFIDNTDVDLITGGGQNRKIQYNNFMKTGSYSGQSFAALMAHDAWVTTDYMGTDFSYNTIDCGSQKRCGFGIYIGGDAWDGNLPGIYRGSFHDNLVKNAQVGFVIDQADSIEIYNNTVIGSGGYTICKSSGVRRLTSDYNISLDSVNIDRSKDTTPDSSYLHEDWNNCIANADWVRPVVSSQFISQDVPTAMVSGATRAVSIIMKNTGEAIWTKTESYRLGSHNPPNNTTWGTNRGLLSDTDSINQNQSKTFTYNITAPATAGVYNFQWKMLQEYVEWFGGATLNLPIQVVVAGSAMTSAISSGSAITVNFNYTVGTNRNWIGLYVVDQTNNRNYIQWRWLDNTNVSGSPPASLISSGAITFTNVPLGNYQVRYLLDGGYSDIDVKDVVVTAPLSITTTSLPSATQGVSYSADVLATGGADDYMWSITSGSLPQGLILDQTTCLPEVNPCQGPAAILGIPTTVGTYSFTVRLTSGTQTASKSLTITVASQADTTPPSSPTNLRVQ